MRPAIQRLLRQIRNSNRTMIARTGEISPPHIAVLIQEAIRMELENGSTLLGLSEFIGAAIDGEILDFDAAATPAEQAVVAK
jgi:hypothetical protein